MDELREPQVVGVFESVAQPARRVEPLTISPCPGVLRLGRMGEPFGCSAYIERQLQPRLGGLGLVPELLLRRRLRDPCELREQHGDVSRLAHIILSWLWVQAVDLVQELGLRMRHSVIGN
ncbi:MAG: hypothetical protein HYV63_05020 [Candidatus Schekmanbacteria bacterium]|nr:hypothetical protein [Candidatus Schekmanbacteria bacterium]